MSEESVTTFLMASASLPTFASLRPAMLMRPSRVRNTCNNLSAYPAALRLKVRASKAYMVAGGERVDLQRV